MTYGVKVFTGLVQVISCHQVGTKPLSETTLLHSFTLNNKIMWNLNKSIIKENLHKNIVCKTVAMRGDTDQIYLELRWEGIIAFKNVPEHSV